MQSLFSLNQLTSFNDNLTKTAYQNFQQSRSAFCLVHKTISDRLKAVILAEEKAKTKPLAPETLLKLKEKTDRILELDWQDAQEGVYPSSILFESFWLNFLRYYPEVWLDISKIASKIKNKEYQQFDPEIDREGYPAYYLQNFHYQTNGYLSDLSANLYDIQVDILFNASADAMRRRILKPLKRGLEAFADKLPQQIKVLDVACGTGRTLKWLRASLPKASLYGIDLSAAYLRKANQLLSENSGELPQLAQANAEALPYLDNYFEAVTSVFLFHELPAEARQNVINEAYRVVKPQGTFVIADSMQTIDSPEFQTMMENFPNIFHEPYYRSYIDDDLTERLSQAGFVDIRVENHFVSKYWIATKSVSSRG
jgi:ubiquinone/menaquinone biosynthesis C-methylase UbiE